MENNLKRKEQPQTVHRVSLEFNSIKIEKKERKENDYFYYYLPCHAAQSVRVSVNYT